MALPDRFKVVEGTPIVLAHSTHAPSAANNFGARTHQIDCTSLPNVQARQSAKFDFGANRDQWWSLHAAIEFALTPVSEQWVGFYLGFSNSATAGTANPAALTGVDGAYTGYSSNMPTAVRQLFHVGNMFTTGNATATVQVATEIGGLFRPLMRYASLVVRNESDAAFHSSMTETSFIFEPLVEEIQD